MSTNQLLKGDDLELDIRDLLYAQKRDMQLRSRAAALEDSRGNIDILELDISFEPFKKSSSNVIPFPVFACWNLLRESGFSEGTFNRILSTAMNRLIPGEPGLLALGAETLTGFMTFWNSVRGLAVEPQITISPKGNIQVEWVKDNENFMVMEFQPTHDVFISLWKNGKPMEGIRSKEDFPELVRTFSVMDENPLRWSNAV